MNCYKSIICNEVIKSHKSIICNVSQIDNLCIVTNLLFVHCNEVIECYKYFFVTKYITCKLSMHVDKLHDYL